MKIKAGIPKIKKSIENDFKDCEKRKRFVKIERKTYKDYIKRAKDDIISAERDLKNNDLYWPLAKIYQSIFFSLNTILVRNYGFFSKDHKCLLTAALKIGLVEDETSKEISLLFDLKKILEETDVIRQERNIALYHPESKKIISKKDVKSAFNVAQKLLNKVVTL